MAKKESYILINLTLVSLLLLSLFYLLYIGSSLIIPFIIALLFSFAIIGLSNFYKKFKIPSFISFILSLLSYVAIFWWLWKLIGNNIDELIRLLPEYQDKVSSIVLSLFETLHIKETASINELLSKINLQYVFQKSVSWVTSIFSSAWIILFYVLFILLEYRFFKDKLYLMIANNSKKFQILETLDKIKNDIKSYFVIKTFVSFCTWLFSFIIMYSFNLDFAMFWALIIFILNFIPSIGSIIAVTFPSLLSLVQPWFSYYDSALMVSGLISIQIFMWNIVEPKFMWNKLNLSPLVIIISLWFWWALWWVVGMLLSVPIMVIINIILAKIPVTRPIAILLSEKWDLQVDWTEQAIENRKKLLKNFKETITSVHKKKKSKNLKK